MNEHQTFVAILENTCYKALDYGNIDPEEVRPVVLHAIYGYVAMRLPTKVSFTLINQACKEIDLFNYADIGDKILSIIERSMNYEPITIDVEPVIGETAANQGKRKDIYINHEPFNQISKITPVEITEVSSKQSIFKVRPLLDSTKVYKIKIPPIASDDLKKMYDYLFDTIGASWVGQSGHYAYGNGQDDSSVAQNQDGYIYCFYLGHWRITADCKNGCIGTGSAIELSIHLVSF
jgi:hypothetical protein